MTDSLFRLIIPHFPDFNEYARTAQRTTALGPLLTATTAAQTSGWTVEVIDENNLRRLPHELRDKNSLNHQALEPASIVGFCVDWSITAPRAFELAGIYSRLGALTIAGGHHVRCLPEEALRNGVDVVVLGEGETTTAEILKAYAEFRRVILECGANNQNYDFTSLLADCLSFIPGIAFLDPSGQMTVNPPNKRSHDCRPKIQPDFKLLRYAKVDVYPLQWRHGCPFNCEFCVAQKKLETAKPEDLIETVEHYAENFGAKNFFIVDDYFGGRDMATKQALRLLADYRRRLGRKLSFDVQTQLNDCLDEDLPRLLRQAGIKTIRLSYRAPIKQELESGQNYSWLSRAIYYTKLWRRVGFKIHGLFMFAYPHPMTKLENGEEAIVLTDNYGNYTCPKVPLADQERQTKKFIRRLRLDELSISLAVPVPGTELRRQLEQDGRLLDFDWQFYDGQFPLYRLPDCEPKEIFLALKRIKNDFRGWRSIFGPTVEWPF